MNIFSAKTYTSSADIIWRLAKSYDLDSRKQGQTLNMSKTQQDVMVTVHWLFADTQRVLLGYITTSTDGQRYKQRVQLTRRDGTVFPYQNGFGVVGSSEKLRITMSETAGAHIAAFQMMPHSSDGESTDMCLTINVKRVVPMAPTSEPAPQRKHLLWNTRLQRLRSRLPGTRARTEIVRVQPMPVVDTPIHTSFVFDFVLPQHKG
ncbi:MAG: hypothetical protein AAGF95_30900 [Chloroflexota bacterium]